MKSILGACRTLLNKFAGEFLAEFLDFGVYDNHTVAGVGVFAVEILIVFVCWVEIDVWAKLRNDRIFV